MAEAVKVRQIRAVADDRIPPHDEDAEKAVLGAMLLSREAIGDAVGVVQASDFYLPAHSNIFETIIGLFASGITVDPITVASALERSGLLALCGGRPYVNALTSMCPTPPGAIDYARTIAELAALRRVQAAAADAITQVRERVEARRITDGMFTKMYDAIAGLDRRQRSRSVSEVVVDIERECETGRIPIEVGTGIASLDRSLGGLRPGMLAVLAARPGMGKSSLALAIARNVAKAGKPVLFMSLEMRDQELVESLVSMETQLPLSLIRSRQLAPRQMERLRDAKTKLAELPFVLDDSGRSLLDLRAEAQRSIVDRGRLGLVVVDYLQLMTPGRSNDNRAVEVAELSRGLKMLARDLGAPVLALSQLNRGVEARPDKRPMLADLRESGAIEADADVVMFIYRDEMYNAKTQSPGVAEVIIAKHRFQGASTARLGFSAPTVSFVDLAGPPSKTVYSEEF